MILIYILAVIFIMFALSISVGVGVLAALRAFTRELLKEIKIIQKEHDNGMEN